MELAASSTLSGLLEHNAVTHPDRPSILAPGRQKFTVAHLHHLEVAAASRILSCSILPGDRVALVIRNTAEEEFEIYLSENKIKLVHTGPPSNDDETRAQAAAARLQIRHAIHSVDFHSSHVDISPRPFPSMPSAGTGVHGLAEVVNKPWDAALLLPGARGAAGSPACGVVMLTQGQLASLVMGQDDVLNLLSELKSCLADVKLVENHYFLGNLSGVIPAACVASGPSIAARVVVQNPTTIGGLVTDEGEVPHGLLAATGELAEVVAGIARAEEHDLKLKDILMLCGAAALAVFATVLSRQFPQAAAEKASVLFLFFLALISSCMGQIDKDRARSLPELFKMGSQFLYI